MMTKRRVSIDAVNNTITGSEQLIRDAKYRIKSAVHALETTALASLLLLLQSKPETRHIKMAHITSLYDMHVVGSALITQLCPRVSMRDDSDLDILMTKKVPGADVLITQLVGDAVMGDAVLKGKKINCGSRFCVFDSDIKNKGLNVQLLIRRDNYTAIDVVSDYDMCQCRIVYNADTTAIRAKYPNLYCAIEGIAATSWSIDGEAITICTEDGLIQPSRIKKYTDMGFVRA